MATLSNAHPDLAAWDRAYRKVALLLRAYQVENAYVRHELAREIVQETLHALPEGHEPEARMISIVQASRIVQRWPQHFLGTGEFEPELLQAVREARIVGVPNLHRASIGVPQIQFDTVSDVAEGTRRLFSNSILRICTFVAIVGAGIATVIYLAR
jgi:hypothetical protein